MDISKLEEQSKKYKELVNEQKVIEGQEKQMLIEKENLINQLKEKGFNNSEELKIEIDNIEKQIIEITNQIESQLNGTTN